MIRKQKKFNFVYKTTNLLNNKYYIGVHSTNTLNDKYLGSGKYLWNSIRKYGRENFLFETLYFFDTFEQALKREKELVTKDTIKDPMCMNIMVGGGGGFNPNVDYKTASKNGNDSRREKLKTDKEYKKRIGKNTSKALKRSHKNGLYKYDHLNWSGKKHKQESKDKIGKANAIKQKGECNSQYGTCWIQHKLHGNKKIDKKELQKYLDEGWIKGRKIKK